MNGRLTESCRAVDPESTDKVIEAARAAADVVRGESAAADAVPPNGPELELDEFGEGLFG